MKKTIAQILCLVFLFSAAKAEDKVQIELTEGSLQAVADYYTILTGKNVEFSAENLKPKKISITTGNTLLPKSKAIKYIELALYIKGFELTARPNGSFILSQYAIFDEHDKKASEPSSTSSLTLPRKNPTKRFTQSPSAFGSRGLVTADVR